MPQAPLPPSSTKRLLHSPKLFSHHFFLKPYSSIAAHGLPHVSPHLPVRKLALCHRKNTPSVIQRSQIDLKRSILERFSSSS
ncbi:hypothetical protein H5410_026884 [Solanum commersonii]|uniref:Uncharacterized protein n=1 Tax=Solanum commersonii TaxID=4109 RepID=A0A9J5Z064_SOLCO|nr:hypothetical protein H5410_026884 [Solanum commersonii]